MFLIGLFHLTLSDTLWLWIIEAGFVIWCFQFLALCFPQGRSVAKTFCASASFVRTKPFVLYLKRLQLELMKGFHTSKFNLNILNCDGGFFLYIKYFNYIVQWHFWMFTYFIYAHKNVRLYKYTKLCKMNNNNNKIKFFPSLIILFSYFWHKITSSIEYPYIHTVSQNNCKTSFYLRSWVF